MSREAVARLTSRMYRHHLESTGRLPAGKEVRGMEEKARRIAERAGRRGKAVKAKG